MLKSSGTGNPASPMLAMCTNAYMRVRVCAMMWAAKRREIVCPCVACRDHCRRRLEGHQLVGRNAKGRTVWVHVRVEVDQARRDELSTCIEHAQRALGRDVRLECLDHAGADADVAPRPQLLARVEHLAALDEEVELVVRPHCGLNGPCNQPRRPGCSDGGDSPHKFTAR